MHTCTHAHIHTHTNNNNFAHSFASPDPSPPPPNHLSPGGHGHGPGGGLPLVPAIHLNTPPWGHWLTCTAPTYFPLPSPFEIPASPHCGHWKYRLVRLPMDKRQPETTPTFKKFTWYSHCVTKTDQPEYSFVQRSQRRTLAVRSHCHYSVLRRVCTA